MNKLVLIGGGGHCRSVIDSIDKSEFEIVGIIDPNEPFNSLISNIPVIGDDDILAELLDAGVSHAFISVGSIGNTRIREKLYRKAKDLGFRFPVIIDRSAIVSKRVNIEDGTFIGKGAIVNTGVEIGENGIINSGCIIEHDCKLSEFVHIAPGATLSGGVQIGSRSHIGTNTTVIQGLIIGHDVIIGAGSVVLKDVSSCVIAYGAPCKRVKPNE